MGKKFKFKTYNLDLGDKKLISLHTNALNKKGELKGKNKKETKVLRTTCLHHKYGKHGKIRSRVDVPDGKTAFCSMCGAEFPAKPYTPEELDKLFGEFSEFLENLCFYATAIGVKEEVLRYLAETKVLVKLDKKIAKKTYKVVDKQESITKKNKKNESPSTIGAWAVKRK